MAKEPDGGKIKFDNYIREHIKIPEKRAAGDSVAVNASLRISYRGIIDSIKILDSPAKAYSDEVLRLLKNGPSWKPAVLNGKKIDDSVRLRIMFK